MENKPNLSKKSLNVLLKRKGQQEVKL